MTKLFTLVLMTLLFSIVLAANASLLEEPAIPIEQAIVSAKRHVASQKIDITNSYLAKAEWQPRSGLISYWRVEWRAKKALTGGQVFVFVYADGRVEHTLEE